MPRKGPAPKRPVVADPVYGAPIVSQLVNKILVDGKKGLAERIVYDALEGVGTKTGQDAVATLKKALDNVRPTLEVKSRRVGGSTYQVPVEVKPHRANTLALRWLVSYAKASSREDDDRAPHERDPRRVERPGCRGQAPRGHPQDGRVEPRLRSLPLVTSLSADRRHAEDRSPHLRSMNFPKGTTPWHKTCSPT